MKRAVLLSVLVVILAFVLPILLCFTPAVRSGSAETPDELPEVSPPPQSTDEPQRTPVLDSGILLTVHTDSGDAEMSMADYLPGAVAGEMPAAFDSEALKAQAVALRSYVLHYRAAHKDTHPDADVCTSAACCAAYAGEAELRERWGERYDEYYSRVCAAVRDTDGQYLVYEAEPILAVFHSSSIGMTEDGADLGTALPYLVSVSSPETADTAANLCTTAEISAEEFRTTVSAACPEALFGGEPEEWVGAVILNGSGRVESIRIGGVSVSGLALRQMFGLRSTDFTLSWDGAQFVFRVRGYGHGLGMSQFGADAMADAGCGYAEILAHYYPGTELVMAMEQRG